jgi:hypothetical protein
MKEDSKGLVDSKPTEGSTNERVAGPTIRITHQTIYPRQANSLDDRHWPMGPLHHYDGSHLNPGHHQLSGPQFQHGYNGYIHKGLAHQRPYDLYVPEYSLQRPAEANNQFWRPLPFPNAPMTQCQFRPIEQQNLSYNEIRPSMRPAFSKPMPLIVEREKAVSDPNFFEECFSPKRTRKLSIDSDGSLDLQKKQQLPNDLDDDAKDIFQVCLAASNRQLKPTDNGKLDYVFNSERIYLRQNSDPKEKPPFTDGQLIVPQSWQPVVDQFKDLADFPFLRGINNTKIQIEEQMIQPTLDCKHDSRGTTNKNANRFVKERIHPLHSYERSAKPIQIPSNLTSEFEVVGIDSENQKPSGAQIKRKEPTSKLARSSDFDLSSIKNDEKGPVNTEEKGKCTCKKSKCLKLYCECFNLQRMCGDQCACVDCFNKEEFQELRSYFLKDILEKNPNAFKSKFKKIDQDNLTLHARGCNCKKTGCHKRYCECYSANTKCTNLCKCTGCSNFCEESKEIAVEQYHEKVLRKRKRKGRSFVQSLMEILKDKKPPASESENP